MWSFVCMYCNIFFLDFCSMLLSTQFYPVNHFLAHSQINILIWTVWILLKRQIKSAANLCINKSAQLLLSGWATKKPGENAVKLNWANFAIAVSCTCCIHTHRCNFKVISEPGPVQLFPLLSKHFSPLFAWKRKNKWGWREARGGAAWCHRH